MPLDPQIRKPVVAQWDFTVLDMDKRIVVFRDMSEGTITSWLWDFDDGSTSTELHPIHQYDKPGEYSVILNVEGPEGKARRIKVRDVVFR